VAAGVASAAVQIRAPLADAIGYVIGQFPVYVTLCAATTISGAPTAGAADAYHVVFGPANVGAPTDADFTVKPVDGLVRVLIPANATHYRVKSDGATGPAGSVYAYLS
jgi:hypothetical protein